LGFNPRARVGRDLGAHAQDHAWLVSIHAPAWGATKEASGISDTIGSFNPRARVGRDRLLRRNSFLLDRFNPRARVGRDAAR